MTTPPLDRCRRCLIPLPTNYDVLIMDADEGVTIYRKTCPLCGTDHDTTLEAPG